MSLITVHLLVNVLKNVRALSKSRMHIFNVSKRTVQSLENVSQKVWEELTTRCATWPKNTCIQKFVKRRTTRIPVINMKATGWHWQTDRQTTDNVRSEKLTWTLSSGELKKRLESVKKKRSIVQYLYSVQIQHLYKIHYKCNFEFTDETFSNGCSEILHKNLHSVD
jgi:predicted Zn-dependent protease